MPEKFNEHLMYYGPVYELLAVNTGRELIYVAGPEADTKVLRHLVKNISKHNTVRVIQAFDYDQIVWALEKQELRQQMPVLGAIADCNSPD